MGRYRTRSLVWAGRALAAAAVAGLAVCFGVIGLDRSGALAGPVAAVVALAGLLAPYLLPAPQPPVTEAPPASPASAPAGTSAVFIADHGSVAAQHIGRVTMNAPQSAAVRPDGEGDG